MLNKIPPKPVRYSPLPQQFADPEPILNDIRALVASGDFTRQGGRRIRSDVR